MSYRAVPLKRVFDSVIRLQGLDPLASRLTPAQRSNRAELITDRIRMAWEAEMWPELLTVEQRQFAPDYDVAETVNTGDIRLYEEGANSGYFVSLADSNAGNLPDFAGATSYWDEVGEDFLPKVDFEQEFAPMIGAIDVKRGVFARDPRLYMAERPLNGCRIIEGAAVLILDTLLKPTKPWLKYRPPAPEVSLHEHNPALAYEAGDVCYVDAAGDSFRARRANTGMDPATSPEDWARVRIPYIIAEYVKHGVVADLEREDQGRLRMEARAEQELERVRDVQFEQRGEIRKVTYGRIK